jgi:phage tail sheath protein FI
MLNFKHPGIYTREIPSNVRTITGAPTSVALFVGPTTTGIDGRAIRIMSFADYERGFGALSQTSNLSYSVLHFFANGGGEAYVIRVPPAGAVPAQSTLKRDAGGNNASFTLTALSAGEAGSHIFFEVDPFGIGADPFGDQPDKKRFNLTIMDQLTGRIERFSELSTSSTSARFAQTVVNDEATGSKLVQLEMDADGIDKEGPKASGSVYRFKALPTGAVGGDINVKVRIDLRKDNGDPGDPASVEIDDVRVYSNGERQPTSLLDASTRLVGAINQAIRAAPAQAEKMQGVEVEGQVFEGAYLRLRTSGPVGENAAARLYDATITISKPTNGASYLTAYLATNPEKIAGPSRYRLGATYKSSEITNPAEGDDGAPEGQPESEKFKNAVTALDDRDPFFNLLCLPDLVRARSTDPNVLQHDNAPAVYAEAARVCRNKHAFLLIDPFPDVVGVGEAESWKSLKLNVQSSHAAAFFPNIRVDDPLVSGSIRSHPPSGALAGVFARTDGQYGVWQAPAGVEASLSGVYGPSVLLSDRDHGILNPLGLNCIRQFPIYGTVNFGSRTVEGSNAAASEWKYIPVRRTASYILRTLSDSLRWAVHKPNGEQLWGQLRMSVTGFMHGLFRQGAFKGVSAREAYFVQCDASTTTPDDMNQGVVNIIVGFAPLRPAEFVVVSLRQIVQPAV